MTETTIDIDQLVQYSKILREPKKNGTKQCISILKDLLTYNLTVSQLKDSKIGSALSKIAKDESHDPDDDQLREAAVQLFKKCKKTGDEIRSQDTKQENDDIVTKNVEEVPEKGLERKDSYAEDRKALHEANRGLQRENSFSELSNALIRRRSSEDPLKVPVEDSSTIIKDGEVGLDKLPLLTPEYRNFTLKSFTDALILDYKSNPKDKEILRPIAQKRAVNLEEELHRKCSNRENDYRMEARNLSTFLIMKNNYELRRSILKGEADCAEFVKNKESFLNQNAQKRVEEVSRKFIDASNADYDKKMVRESLLYQCSRCKSRKINKIEKQTRGGDEPMTSFFNCVDCGKGWKT